LFEIVKFTSKTKKKSFNDKTFKKKKNTSHLVFTYSVTHKECEFNDHLELYKYHKLRVKLGYNFSLKKLKDIQKKDG